MAAVAPLTIAYVEDDPDHILEMQDLLGRWLLNPVEIYTRGENLLTRLSQKIIPKPGIILVDLSLPDMHGTDIIRAIRADHKDLLHVPKIIVTGSDDETAVDSARQAGADAYIVKPLRLHSLMGALNKVAPYAIQIMPGQRG